MVLDESVFGRKCFWMSFFFSKLDEIVPNREPLHSSCDSFSRLLFSFFKKKKGEFGWLQIIRGPKTTIACAWSPAGFVLLS